MLRSASFILLLSENSDRIITISLHRSSTLYLLCVLLLSSFEVFLYEEAHFAQRCQRAHKILDRDIPMELQGLREVTAKTAVYATFLLYAFTVLEELGRVMACKLFRPFSVMR